MSPKTLIKQVALALILAFVGCKGQESTQVASTYYSDDPEFKGEVNTLVYYHDNPEFHNEFVEIAYYLDAIRPYGKTETVSEGTEKFERQITFSHCILADAWVGFTDSRIFTNIRHPKNGRLILRIIDKEHFRMIAQRNAEEIEREIREKNPAWAHHARKYIWYPNRQEFDAAEVSRLSNAARRGLINGVRTNAAIKINGVRTWNTYTICPGEFGAWDIEKAAGFSLTLTEFRQLRNSGKLAEYIRLQSPTRKKQ